MLFGQKVLKTKDPGSSAFPLIHLTTSEEYRELEFNK